MAAPGRKQTKSDRPDYHGHMLHVFGYRRGLRIGGTLLIVRQRRRLIDSEQETTREDFGASSTSRAELFWQTTSALYEQIAEALVQVDFGEDFHRLS